SLCPTRLRQGAMQRLIEGLERLVADGGACGRTVEERDAADVQPVDRRAPGVRDGGDELVFAARVSHRIADRDRAELPLAPPCAERMLPGAEHRGGIASTAHPHGRDPAWRHPFVHCAAEQLAQLKGGFLERAFRFVCVLRWVQSPL